MPTQDDTSHGGIDARAIRYSQAQIGLCYLDTELRYVAINEWLAALNGLAPAQHVGRKIRDILPSVADGVEGQLRQVIQTGEPVVEGLAWVETAAHPGAKRLYQHDYYADKAADGTVQGVECTIQDITHQRLAGVMGVIPWEADARTGEFSYVGPQAEEILGYPVERWYESGFRNSCIHPDDRQRVIDLHSTSPSEGLHYELEYRMITADNTITWLRDVVDVDCMEGKPIVLRGFMFDISAIKEASREIEELTRRLKQQKQYLHEEVYQTAVRTELIGNSDLMCEVNGLVEQVAPTNATVLITGETGTGKELVARSVHAHGSRAGRLMVQVNCATLPSNLIESELFGHEKGAFTGAVRRHIGRFELADGGTIFLDEIGDLPLELQPKLLRVLQEGEFERLGSTKTTKVDVRVIAATNRDLEQAVDAREFREDLYYRLHVFPIQVPPLRERPEDIALLVWYFLDKTKLSIGRPIDSVPDDVMQRLERYPWPGNVRELENVIERSVILTGGTSLQIGESFGRNRVGHTTAPAALNGRSARLEDVEREHILSVLEECGWYIKGRSNAAERLGLHPSTVLHRMKKLGIERPSNNRQMTAPNGPP